MGLHYLAAAAMLLKVKRRPRVIGALKSLCGASVFLRGRCLSLKGKGALMQALFCQRAEVGDQPTPPEAYDQ